MCIKTCQKWFILIVLSAHIEKVCVFCMQDFSDGFLEIFCWILTILCHVDNFKSIWGPNFPVESHTTFGGQSRWYYSWYELLSQNSWEGEVHFFITTNFQTIVRGAQGHPTGSMISCIFTCPMNYSCVVSKHSISYKSVSLPTPI